MLATSGLVCTAFAMGADWLATGVVGLPLGAWLVASAGAAAHAWSGGSANIASVRRWLSRRSTIARPIPARTRFELHETVPEHTLHRAGLGLAKVGNTLQRATARLVTNSAAGTVTIGVDATEADFRAIVSAIGVFKPGGAEIDVVRADAGLIKDAPDDAQRFDALLRRTSDGEYYVFVPENDAHPAAIEAWSSPCPIGYSTCFPVRLDTARMELGPCDLSDAPTCEVVCALATVAAVLGRSPARLAGLNGLPSMLGKRSTLANFSSILEAGMNHLGETLGVIRHGRDQTRAVSAATRLFMAHLATHTAGTGGEERLTAAERAARLLGDEPANMLRLGAIQVAAGKDDAAIDTFVRVCQVLRAHEARCSTDPLVYVMSESDLGQPDGLTLGRIAAGVTLMYATAPQNTMTYLRDDLLEDLESTRRFSHDPDGLMLVRTLVDRLCRSAQTRAADAAVPQQTPRTRRRRKAA